MEKIILKGYDKKTCVGKKSMYKENFALNFSQRQYLLRKQIAIVIQHELLSNAEKKDKLIILQDFTPIFTPKVPEPTERSPMIR